MLYSVISPHGAHRVMALIELTGLMRLIGFVVLIRLMMWRHRCPWDVKTKVPPRCEDTGSHQMWRYRCSPEMWRYRFPQMWRHKIPPQMWRHRFPPEVKIQVLPSDMKIQVFPSDVKTQVSSSCEDTGAPQMWRHRCLPQTSINLALYGLTKLFTSKILQWVQGSQGS